MKLNYNKSDLVCGFPSSRKTESSKLSYFFVRNIPCAYVSNFFLCLCECGNCSFPATPLAGGHVWCQQLSPVCEYKHCFSNMDSGCFFQLSPHNKFMVIFANYCTVIEYRTTPSCLVTGFVCSCNPYHD